MINQEILTLTLEGLAVEDEKQKRLALISAIECKMPLIKSLLYLKITCCAPCHRWRMGK